MIVSKRRVACYQERAIQRRAFVLASKFKGKKKVTFHKGSQKKINTKGKNIDTSKIKCFNCNKLGHFASDCWYRKKNPRKGKHHASTVEDDESKRNQKSPSNERENRKEYYLVSALSSIVITGPKTWLVESGSSKHMTGYKEILSDFKKKSFAEQVELGDDKRYKIEGVRSISFRLEYGAMLHVDEVLYVSGLMKNLLSVATLEDRGYWMIFKDRKALLWAKGSHLSTAKPIGTRRGGLYVVTEQSVQALAHDATSSSELWHRRLGDLHYTTLPNLQNMVCGMPSISFSKNEICKGCMLGKKIKKVFHSSGSRAQGILDLVHSDVCGPMSSPSLSGCLYYVIFVDDCSRKCWIYFLKAKNDTFDKFKEYKSFIEKQTGKHIKTLRTDNGGEFESLQIEDFCKEAGIKRQLTMPYNPQQNGVAERKNMTICEAAKAMMFHQDLPNSLWEEATSTAMYIHNRCPHAILKEKTLEEVFSRTKPEVGHLRIIGCPVYIHVPKEKRTKMEHSGKKGIFVGYSENSKAYKIYVPG
jgi:transposase InsO family protein